MRTGFAANPTTIRPASSPIFEALTAPLAGGSRGWWFEDAVPGQLIRHPGGRTIGDAEHVWLAWVTHNVSDVHGNADAASSTVWGQPLVLGMLSVAIVIGLAQPAMGPSDTAAIGHDAGWSAIKLERPVLAGDTLRAESLIERVEAVEAAPYGRVERTILGRKQDGSVVVRVSEQRDILRRIR
jgi:itaconyl-CoA hydratase